MNPRAADGRQLPMISVSLWLDGGPFDPTVSLTAWDKKLSPRDIELLEKNGYDLHGGEKSGGAGSDLYKEAEGNVCEKPKGGAGPGESINANLNHLRGR